MNLNYEQQIICERNSKISQQFDNWEMSQMRSCEKWVEEVSFGGISDIMPAPDLYMTACL